MARTKSPTDLANEAAALAAAGRYGDAAALHRLARRRATAAARRAWHGREADRLAALAGR